MEVKTMDLRWCGTMGGRWSFSEKVGGAKWLIDWMLCFAVVSKQEPECHSVYNFDSFALLR